MRPGLGEVRASIGYPGFVEVRVRTEQLFVNPVSGSLWVRDLDTQEGRVVVGSLESPPGSAQFQAAHAECGAKGIFVVFHTERAPTAQERVKIVDVLRKHVDTDPVAFVLQQETGRAMVELSEADAAQTAAVAVAVLKAAWAWDESPSFTISVNGKDYAVATEFDGIAWQGEVLPC